MNKIVILMVDFAEKLANIAFKTSNNGVLNILPSQFRGGNLTATCRR